MNPRVSSILTINGGSSSLRFAIYEPGEPSQKSLSGTVDRIGLSGTTLMFDTADGKHSTLTLTASDHTSVAVFLIG